MKMFGAAPAPSESRLCARQVRMNPCEAGNLIQVRLLTVRASWYKYREAQVRRVPRRLGSIDLNLNHSLVLGIIQDTILLLPSL